MNGIILDRFHWAKKVSRRDLQRLYESDARGMLDEDLLNKVFYGMHARILDMFEVQNTQQHGQVKCRSCGAVLPQPFRMGTRYKPNPLHCEQCGWQVTCGEFFKSYSGKDLLPGSRPDVFKTFLERCPEARTPQARMLLVDWIIHEFHINAGITGRPVARNVIDGSTAQVTALLFDLASGSGSTPGLYGSAAWAQAEADPIRRFRREHNKASCLQIAERLGVRGCGKMSHSELLAEIYRLAPRLFAEEEGAEGSSEPGV